MTRLLVGIIVAAFLVGCASTGAGRTQEPCGLAEVKQATPGAGTQQGIAQQAEGGQKASNQPEMTDIAPWSPSTVWGGGQGNVTSSPEWWSERAMSGAPATTQALHADVAQDAENVAGGAGVHPLISVLQKQIESANAALACAIAQGHADTARAIMADRLALIEKMTAASAACRPDITYNYEYGGYGEGASGAMISQGVSSSSGANSRPGSASTGEDGTDVAPARPPVTVDDIQREAGVQPMPAPAPKDPMGTPPAGVAVPE